MTDNKNQFFNAILRTDFSLFAAKCLQETSPNEPYTPNWHHEALAYHLMRCMNGQCKRLLITMPPRELKTHFSSVSFSAYLLGHRPTEKIIAASYNRELAETFSNDTRDVMEADWYKEIFPNTRLSSRKNTAGEFKTTQRGGRLATSVNSTATGKGGNFIIVDDPHNVREANSENIRQGTISWFRDSLITRTDNADKACFIVVQQRVHPDDLAGYLIGTGQWEHLNLPAISPEDQYIPTGDGDDNTHFFEKGMPLDEERLSLRTLEQKKKDMGELSFTAQFLQNPVPLAGNVIPVKDFRPFTEIPTPQSGDWVGQSWDLAFSDSSYSDYSVGTTWLVRGHQFYLIDLFRKKLSFTQLKAVIESKAQEFNASTVLVEGSGAGASMVTELQNKPFSVIKRTPVLGKTDRALLCAPFIERGQLHVRLGAEWSNELINECRAFPNGKHDDQVDSISQFLNWVQEKQGGNNTYTALSDGLDHLAKGTRPKSNGFTNKEKYQSLIRPGSKNLGHLFWKKDGE